MIGYKGSYEGRCKNITYKPGYTYIFDGELQLYKNGIHFCSTIGDVFEYYPPLRNLVIFEINSLGEEIIGCGKCVGNKIEIVRAVPREEWEQFFGGNQYEFDENKNLIHWDRSFDKEEWRKYDGNGKLVELKTHWYGNNVTHTKIFEYNESNKLIHTFSTKDDEEWFDYDRRGNLIYIKKGKNIECFFQYDKNNDRIYQSNNEHYSETFVYDSEHNAISGERWNGKKWSILIVPSNVTREDDKTMKKNCEKNTKYIAVKLVNFPKWIWFDCEKVKESNSLFEGKEGRREDGDFIEINVPSSLIEGRIYSNSL